MSKAIKAFFGSDTYGRSVERAQRDDGVWFSRAVEFNGYANAFCKWYQDEPHYITETKMQVEQGVFENVKHDPIMAWGWNRMTEYDAPLRFRLPKAN